MTRRNLRTICLSALAAAGLSAAALPALADKPAWAGAGKGQSNREARDDRDRDGGGRYFDDRRRTVAHEYYREEFHGGRCPPGLAKKHNGCMPPGQARKWRVGRPLPKDVVIYDVPPALVVKIGLPPAGYKYVRVASDILMIAVGTNMVADAIKDLGRR